MKELAENLSNLEDPFAMLEYQIGENNFYFQKYHIVLVSDAPMGMQQPKSDIAIPRLHIPKS